MKNWFSSLFVGQCILCRGSAQPGLDICAACEKDLPYAKHLCERCGAFLENVAARKALYCGACLNKKLPFEKVLAIFYYQQPISRLLPALKFRNRLVYAKLLGSLMGDALKKHYENEPWPGLIIPVPLHLKRLRERGFNQALELAKPIAANLKIPLDRSSCLRIKHTVAQTSLHIAARRKNLTNAFNCKKRFTQKHVAIIDDVLTTGSTVRTFSKTLRKFGVEKIDVWCCAKVVLRNEA